MKKAVILFSGGLDSTTCLAIAKDQGFACYTLSFNYGQRHAAELIAAKKISEHMGAIDHRVVNLDIGQFGGSALTDPALCVPDFQETEAIPITYVPARNTIFLAMALGFAETIQAEAIYIGVNAIDYSHYPDCRPAFIQAFQTLANLATKSGVEGQTCTLHAPLLHLSKADIVRAGVALGVNYGLTVSCYQLTPEGVACGRCDSCVLRKQGFARAQVADPTRYV